MGFTSLIRLYCRDRQLPAVPRSLALGVPPMTVHQGVAYTTAFFNPEETEVGHVLMLGPEETRGLKSYARYRIDEELWLQGWLASGSSLFPDWKTRPKLEDYR